MPSAHSNEGRQSVLPRRSDSFSCSLINLFRNPTPHKIALGILLITIVIYLKICVFDFIDFDDPLYLTQNPVIQTGMNANSLYYAFTTTIDGSYLPIVWISHAVCVSLFSDWAGGHHLVNLVLHLSNAVLLFYFLHRITELKWPSAGVALLFAIHPLHVESVAWIAERKDVLSTFFWLLTSWAYVSYTERPSVQRYLWMLIPFVLGLLSKSMLMTLPVTLLLLDWWPLNRIKPVGAFLQNWPRFFLLIQEKIPLFTLSLVAALITLSLQYNVGATNAQTLLPIQVRIGNALMSSVEYLRQTVWPVHLSPFYPYPEVIYKKKIAFILLSMMLVTIGALLEIRRRPYLAVGWLWYLVTLLPVIGIIQIGSQAHADRYTYIPLIGIFIIIAWWLREIHFRAQSFRAVLMWSLGVLLAMIVVLAFYQVKIWENSFKLWEYAIRLNPKNFLAHQRLGDLYFKERRYREASDAYEQAANYLQSYSMYIKWGDTLQLMGFSDQALAAFRAAQGQHVENGQLWATHPPIIDQRIGRSLTRLGRYEEADSYNQTAIQRLYSEREASAASDMAASLIDQAVILRERNECLAALRTLRSVLEHDPNQDLAYLESGLTFEKMGRKMDAFYQIGLTSKKSLERPDLLYLRGLILARTGHFKEAQDTFKLIGNLVPGSPLVQKGRFELDGTRRSAE